MAKSSYLIVYFSKTKIYFHTPGSESFKALDITELVSDLSVVDHEQFEQAVVDFLEKSKLKKLPLVVIFASNLYFSKEIKSDLNPEEQAKQAEKFLSYLPFDLLYHHQFKHSETIELIAINRSLYEPFLRTMKEAGFSLEVVTTEDALKLCFSADGFSIELAGELQNSIGGLKDFNFIDNSKSGKKEKLGIEEKKEFEKFEVKTDEEPSKKRLIFLGLVFFGLILILIGLILWTRKQQQQLEDSAAGGQAGSQKNKLVLEQKKPSLPPTTTPEATSSAQTATDSADLAEDLNLEDLQINVLNGSGVAGRAAGVQEQLEDLGFTQVEVGNTDQISGSKSLVMFSQDIDPAIKDLVVKALNQTEADFTAKTSSQLDADVVITLYK